ncbi:MAG TPA: hypothetical protein VL691_12270 [Vicinamibacteria bacterium]|nr:hypothetical protein [Vicinamibacteria bacterium]
MRLSSFSVGPLLAAVSGLAGPVAASEPGTVLRRAGAAVAALEGRLAVAVAREEYRQTLDPGTETRRERDVVSEVVWVSTDDAFVWAFFRDALAVDGRPVGDRAARLQRLFSGGPTPEAREQAARILDESARYNIGLRRTLNNPTVALSFLHPRNQPRFRFAATGPDSIEGMPALRVRFAEKGRQTLIRTPTGTGIPARGVLWVGLDDAVLVRSELDLDVPGLGPSRITVLYRPQPRLEAWLPVEMQESYGPRGKAGHLEAVARYSDYRKAEVEVQDIVPAR